MNEVSFRKVVGLFTGDCSFRKHQHLRDIGIHRWRTDFRLSILCRKAKFLDFSLSNKALIQWYHHQYNLPKWTNSLNKNKIILISWYKWNYRSLIITSNKPRKQFKRVTQYFFIPRFLIRPYKSAITLKGLAIKIVYLFCLYNINSFM